MKRSNERSEIIALVEPVGFAKDVSTPIGVECETVVLRVAR
jgi:hypothetical protein